MRSRHLKQTRSVPPPTVTSLQPALTWLRTAIVATMALITLAWPIPERMGFQSWIYIVAFAIYVGIVELIRLAVPRLNGYGWVAVVDLLMAGVLYWLDGEPGGPLFVAFYLAVVTAAVSHPLRLSAPLIAAVVLTIVVTTWTLPRWDSRPGQIQELSTRLLVMGAVGIGTALLTRKLASQRDIAAAIQRESTRIDELNRLRGDFIASVSHDLKTPLTSANASLGLLHMHASDRLEPDQRALLANARRNVDRLGMFIEDLISASQLTSGIMVLEREFLDLRDVVADAMGTLFPLMQAKSQVLQADLSEELSVNGDRKRLGQVCMNLLANAHQHTPPGTIVEIAGHRDDSLVVLSITDNGPGIPSEALDDIFQPFYRLSNDTVGSGLGLANARRFIELHGGRLTAARADSGGSIFQITLPIAHMQGGQ